ncbi:MAG: HTH-type transcriptional regulator BhcR [Rhizobiaceae bacterium]
MDEPQQERRQRGRPRAFKPSPDAAQVQALDRGLAVLGVVAAADGLSLSEIAASSGLAPSTAYRMLTTLEAHGMVEFDKAEQLWSVGVGAYRTGAAFLRRRKLVDRARGIMQELVEETGETANLGVAEPDCVVFVTQVETHQAIRAFFRPGARSPLHASGIGKAVLAFMPEPRLEALIKSAGLDAYTTRTLAEPASLRRDLAAVRARGWALDDEERHDGMRCVAAPIFDEQGQAVAGVSVSGPTVRMTPERAEAVAPMVVAAAAAITASIGGVAPG